jgi:nucleoside-diphosphate-sugar epimerase
MKILITGGNGYIAKSLYSYLYTDYDITVITRDDFDLTDRSATDLYFRDKHFDLVIHAAIKGGNRLHVDESTITHENLSMFYNLWNNKHKFNQLISFGSGAEDGTPSSPYGLSKHVISKLIDNIAYFYNIRIFGVFDENELQSRFIKSNIKRYLDKQPIIIHQDKYMDFFYMKDLVSVVKFYLKRNRVWESPPKCLDCCYQKKYMLSDIAMMINELDSHRVEIIIESVDIANPYTGIFDTPVIENTNIPVIDYIGIESGIQQVYEKLRKNEN